MKTEVVYEETVTVLVTRKDRHYALGSGFTGNGMNLAEQWLTQAGYTNFSHVGTEYGDDSGPMDAFDSWLYYFAVVQSDPTHIVVMDGKVVATVHRERFGVDPVMTAHLIEVRTTENPHIATGGALWRERYGTEVEKEAFIRGVQAGMAMFGHYGLQIVELNESG